MSAAGRTLQPWLHRSGTFAKPNALLVRLKLGETADRIPAAMDVRRKLVRPAETTEHGALDRVVKSFGGGVRVCTAPRRRCATSAIRTAAIPTSRKSAASRACYASRSIRGRMSGRWRSR